MGNQTMGQGVRLATSQTQAQQDPGTPTCLAIVEASARSISAATKSNAWLETSRPDRRGALLRRSQCWDRRWTAGTSRNITGASQPGNRGGSRPPNGTTRIYSPPPIVRASSPSNSHPNSAAPCRIELFSGLRSAASLNGNTEAGRGGPNVMAGYWDRADATVDAFREGSYDPIVEACLTLAGR
jgi:hypothetical protein